MGIEPTLFAWEARVLPLNDARMSWQDHEMAARIRDRGRGRVVWALSYIKPMRHPPKIWRRSQISVRAFPQRSRPSTRLPWLY